MSSDLEGFDRYCAEHEIKPEERGAAFGAWLNKTSGWDGQLGEVPVGTVLWMRKEDGVGWLVLVYGIDQDWRTPTHEELEQKS